MRLVTHPVAVNPDPPLLAEARQRGWPIIQLPVPEAAQEVSR
jgi:phosphoserine phosphatase